MQNNVWVTMIWGCISRVLTETPNLRLGDDLQATQPMYHVAKLV